MTDQPILRARTQEVAVAPAAARETLDIQLQKATAIARAGDMLPKGYRAQPGAIVLAMDWADRHGLSIMDAIHGVAWVQGRPVIDASLQRALAQNAGYRVLVRDVSTEAATVTVSTPTGELLGTATYTMDEARTAGLASKDNWKKNPADMLVARASTRAIKWYCPGVLIGGALSPDEVEQVDDLATLVATEPEPEAAPVDIVEAEVVEAPERLTVVPDTPASIVPAEETGPSISPATKGAVRAVFEQAKSDERFQALSEALKAEGIPLAVGSLSEAQGARVIKLADNL